MSNPKFYYAITEETISNLPTILDGKEITAEQFMPTRTREKDTGYDVRCAETNEIVINGKSVRGLELIPGCYFKMRLGFRMYAPEGWWLNLAPRSGTFINDHIHALYGIIEETYENEMCFVGQFLPNACDLIPTSERYVIPFGKRIAQVVVSPRYSQDRELISNDEINAKYKNRNDPRGVGGFGSSGAA